jgi:GT2 family glycosyltransferase
MAKLSVHLVAWNGAKYITHALSSLRAQTYKDWELLAIDNASTDGTADLIEKEIKDFPARATLTRNEKNKGFAGGHNQAVRMTTTPYFQLYNQDIYLAPDYLEKVVAMMDAHPEAGAGQGLLLRWDFGKM